MEVKGFSTTYLQPSLSVPILYNKPTTIGKFCVRNCSISNFDAHNSRKLVLEVKERLKNEYRELPTGKNGRDDESMIFWFLKDRNFSVDEAVKRLHKAIMRNEDEKLCVFQIEKALSKLPEGQEQILGIIDLRGFGTANADMNFLTFLFDVFYYYYPKRLAQVLFVEAPFVFKPIWELAKPLLKKYAALVRFCSVKTVREEYFTEETMPSIFR